MKNIFNQPLKKMVSLFVAVILACATLGTCVFALANPDLIVIGEDNFYQSITPGEANYTTYKAFNKTLASSAQPTFTYSLDTAPTGVTIDSATGELKVPQSVAIGQTIVIRAALSSDSTNYALKTVTVQNSLFYDFDNTKSGWPSANIKDDGSGNQWYSHGSNSGIPDAITFASSGVGKSTLSYKTKNIANDLQMIIGKGYKTFDEFIAGTPTAGDWTHTMQAKVNGDTVKFKSGNIESAASYDNTNWINIKHIIDFDNKKVITFIGTAKIAETNLTANLYAYLGLIKPSMPIDDVRVTSGTVRVLSVEPIPNISKPYSGKPDAKVQVKANDIGAPLTFTLSPERQSISIDADSGLISLSPSFNGGRSQFTVTISGGGQQTAVNFWTLGHFENFQNYSANATGIGPFDDTSYITDSAKQNKLTAYQEENSDNIYIYYDGNRFNYRNNQSYPITGKYIVEADILNSEVNNIFGAVFFSDIIGFEYSMPQDTSKWHNIKAVIDSAAKTYTIILDGAPIAGKINQPLNLPNQSEPQLRGPMFNQKVDNIAIYTIGDYAPIAYNLTLGAPTVGSPLTGSYSYYSIQNRAESGTSVEYLTSFSLNGVYTPIAQSYIPTTNDMYKFFKLRVIPQSEGELVGTAYETAPQTIGDIELVTFTASSSEGEISLEPQSLLTAGMYTVNLNLKYKAAKASGYNLILAIFDKDGAVKSLKALDMDLQTATSVNQILDFSVAVPFTQTSAGSQICVYLWENNSFTPIFNGISVNAAAN